MRVDFFWPGRTKRPELRGLEDFYIGRIRMLADCRVVVTPVARGLDERQAGRILEIEARS
jgi:hypothetical protein